MHNLLLLWTHCTNCLHVWHDNYILQALFAYPNWVWWLTLILEQELTRHSRWNGELLLITWIFYGLEPILMSHHLPSLPDVHISPRSGRDMLSPATTDAPSQVRGPDCEREREISLDTQNVFQETSVATNELVIHLSLHSWSSHIFKHYMCLCDLLSFTSSPLQQVPTLNALEAEESTAPWDLGTF